MLHVPRAIIKKIYGWTARELHVVSKQDEDNLTSLILLVGLDIISDYLKKGRNGLVSDEHDKEFALSFQLEEGRRKYDKVDTLYNGMRTRMFTLLSIQLAIMAYLFSDLQSLVPHELYGILFFAAGAVGLAVSIGTLFYYYRSIRNWPTPIGPVEILKINHLPSRINTLEVACEDYEVAYHRACAIYAQRARALNFSLHAFTISVIILIVLKFASI